MITKNILLLLFFVLCTSRSLCEAPLVEQFQQTGYVEICNETHGAATFDSLYACFDEFIEFLQTNQRWAHILYSAKERFIRSTNRNYYSTNFFGFYDESAIAQRSQISFYYATHFHEFIRSYYPQLNQIPQITRFFDACRAIQEPYGDLFSQVASKLGLDLIFSSPYNHPPMLLKVVKYFPSYNPTKPHYDGTAFSLLLDSTDNQALLLSAYKPSFTIDDFSSPARKFSRQQNKNSLLLIPGSLLTEFSIYPTPHLVAQNHKVRYATIAFAMRPNHTPQNNNLAPLPRVKH